MGASRCRLRRRGSSDIPKPRGARRLARGGPPRLGATGRDRSGHTWRTRTRGLAPCARMEQAAQRLAAREAWELSRWASSARERRRVGGDAPARGVRVGLAPRRRRCGAVRPCAAGPAWVRPCEVPPAPSKSQVRWTDRSVPELDRRPNSTGRGSVLVLDLYIWLDSTADRRASQPSSELVGSRHA